MTAIINYYPRRGGAEKYVKDQFQKDIYIKQNNREIYAFDFSKKRQIFAKNQNNSDFYAKSENNNEIYPVFLDSGFQRFALVDNVQIYALDQFGNEKYPLNRSRREKLAKNELQKQFYAKFANGNEFYPVDDLKNEWAFKENNEIVLAVTSQNEPKVPILNNGKVKYVKENHKEVLYNFENKLFFGKDVSGEEIYPLDENNNQYYPIYDSKPLIAKNAAKQYKYALDKFQKIIYPRDASGVEQYIEYFVGLKLYCSLENQINNFNRYVSSNKYPQKNTTKYGTTNVIIKNKLLDFYPADCNGNEFTNESGHIIHSLGYPITNDSFIIVPNVDNKPSLKPGDDYLLKHIKYLLFRPCYDTYDFLTDIKSKRKSNFKTRSYKVLNLNDYKLNTFKTEYYIIGSLVLLIFILLICVFSKK